MKKKVIVGIILAFMVVGCGRSYVDECRDDGMGPSAGVCFMLGGTENYPEFSFYYLGNVFGITKIEIGEVNQVYKLTTNITVYAVPTESDKGKAHNLIERDGIASQKISIKAGKTVLKIISFDKENKKMQLEVIK